VGFKLTTGTSWSPPSNWAPEGAISVWGATTGQQYTIAEA
jgi:hypothetical protein